MSTTRLNLEYHTSILTTMELQTCSTHLKVLRREKRVTEFCLHLDGGVVSFVGPTGAA
jgi:hypothetical protein